MARVAAEDLVLLRGRKIQGCQTALNQFRIHPGMIARVEQPTRPTMSNAKRIACRQGRDDIEVDLLDVCAGRLTDVLGTAFQHLSLLIHPPDRIWKRTAQLRPNQFQFWVFVKDAGQDDSLQCNA